MVWTVAAGKAVSVNTGPSLDTAKNVNTKADIHDGCAWRPSALAGSN